MESVAAIEPYEIAQITSQIVSLIQNGVHEALFRFYIKDNLQSYSIEVGKIGHPLKTNALRRRLHNALEYSLKLIRRGTGNIVIQSDVVAIKKIPRRLKIIYPVLETDLRFLYDIDEVVRIKHPTAVQAITYVPCKELRG